MKHSFIYEKLRYGFFVHYVANLACYPDGRKTQTVDEAADGFDVRGFADDLEAMRAQYLIFTAWHYQVRPLYPSKVMEKWRPGNFSKRDLVGEIIDAVTAKGIRVLLYTHPRDGHDLDEADRVRTGWGLGCHEGMPDTPNPQTFDYAKWNDFMLSLYGELMDRYGRKIDGLYLDGMGPGRFVGGAIGSESYEFPIIDYIEIRKIAKSVNPNLALIQNYFGYKFTCDFAMPEAFFGYENKHPETRVWPACEKSLAVTCFKTWGASAAKGPNVAFVTPEDVTRFTVFHATCNTAGGVAWASGPYCGGGWETGVMETIKQVGRHIERLGESVNNIVPSTSWPTVSGDTLESREWVVACSSRERIYEYIHIMKQPKDGILTLPAPQDGATLSNPVIIGCKAVVAEFRQDQSGLYLRLDGPWDELDTVVRLTRHNNSDAPVIEWRNDTDSRFIYNGQWMYEFLHDSEAHTRFHGNYEYDAHITHRDGDWWSTTFEGDAVEIIGPVDPDGGKADVLIDRIKVGQIDNVAPERKNRQVLFASDRLYGGLHEIKVIKTGGKTIELDAIRITR